ncbi:choice-of-anchor I family protein [Roseivirga sp. BDSF3-8]|uniref:choice-of-anchor I family protein n=1 Tax=Roseivirga sp. BDSF3-8 TaxID=3241598 RepID=UPI003531CA75
MRRPLALLLITSLGFSLSCNDDDESPAPAAPVATEDPSAFSEIGEISLAGGEGAAEISAYDATTKKLFVVNNADASRIDVVDIANPASPSFDRFISVSANVNSVAVSNGILAAAVEGANGTDNGLVLFFNTSDFQQIQAVTVGALPDMVTFSPDGAYAVVANEGEPNDAYTTDPEGSVSIITMSDYSVNTLGFGFFASQQSTLEAGGFRVFGPHASFAQDIEPEYVTISEDSRTAWVSLQENNGIARIDLSGKAITAIFPLGTKDFSQSPDLFDVSDEDNALQSGAWPVKSFFMPDALASFTQGNVSYVVSANEGDARDYDGYSEEARVEDLILDPAIFPEASTLQQADQLGRLKITLAQGNTDQDDEYEELYAYGGRSFSIWNGATGELVYDSGNDTETRVQQNSSLYPDNRSDDKGTEPEGVTVGRISNRTIAFIGLERADAVLLYDISNPASPTFLQLLETGDAPEGLLFISAEDSPTGRSLLVVSSEGDGVVKLFEVGVM